MKSTFTGTVEQGKFQAENSEAFKRSFYQHEKKRVLVTVERFRKKRSDPQNKYYWEVVIGLVSDVTGYDAEEAHEMLKAQCNSKIVVMHGQEIRVPQSTAKLNTQEFSEYIARVQRFASEFLDLFIPDPNK